MCWETGKDEEMSGVASSKSRHKKILQKSAREALSMSFLICVYLCFVRLFVLIEICFTRLTFAARTFASEFERDQ